MQKGKDWKHGQRRRETLCICDDITPVMTAYSRRNTRTPAYPSYVGQCKVASTITQKSYLTASCMV